MLIIVLLSGDLTDHDSCVDERMDYHGNTSINMCIDWIGIFQYFADSTTAIERDVFNPINFNTTDDELVTLGNKCR